MDELKKRKGLFARHFLQTKMSKNSTRPTGKIQRNNTTTKSIIDHSRTKHHSVRDNNTVSCSFSDIKQEQNKVSNQKFTYS